MDKFKTAWQYIFDGHFIVSFVRWMTRTGGNIGESAFLLATLWVIINAVAHVLLTWFMPTHMIELINYLAVIAFSALPELIIIPVIGVCFSHWALARQGNKSAWLWAILYTIPAIVFLVMTIITVSTFVSTGGTNFVPADGAQLVVRCLAGWLYAAVNMLFAQLGKPHYASIMSRLETDHANHLAQIEADHVDNVSRLKADHSDKVSRLETDNLRQVSELEDKITGLNREMDAVIASFTAEKSQIVESYSVKIEHLSLQLEMQNQTVYKLSERASSLEFQGLENYPIVVSEWLKNGLSTVSLEVINRDTGHSKRKILATKLRTSARNKELYLVSSVVDWLRRTPPPESVNGRSNIVSIEEYIEQEA